METVDIHVIHVSDLHISEEFIGNPDGKMKFPHRYGHHPGAFWDLDTFLKNSKWNALILSGDLSRVGNANSFFILKNWLEGSLKDGERTLGLNIKNDGEKCYVVVPGNHDCFNGKFNQVSLENYERQFPAIKPGSTSSIEVNGIKVNFHPFDSTLKSGSFAYGEVEAEALGAKILKNDELDIAVLHHHFIQPPDHEREYDTELRNCAEVAAHMLGTGYDAVLFGHTHKSYLSHLRTTYITRSLQDKRRIPRLWSRLFAMRLLDRLLKKKFEAINPVSYARERTKNGNYPLVEDYFKYLYLKEHENLKIKGPAEHDSSLKFSEYINSFPNNNVIRQGVDNIRDKKTLVSMAPSVCQAEAKKFGLHEIIFSFTSGTLSNITTRIYRRDGTGFVLSSERSSPVPQGNKDRP